MNNQQIISIDSVTKSFDIGYIKHENALFRVLGALSGKWSHTKKLPVLQGVSLQVSKGDRIGLVGRNGSGKSTLLRLIAGIYEKDGGGLRVEGSTQYISGFSQGLKPKLTMHENIYLMATILGLSEKDIDSIFEAIVEFSGLRDFLYTKVHQFSSGMVTRLAFSVFAHSISVKKPDILLLDEVIGAGGDIDFMSKAYGKMHDLLHSGATVIFVSHSLPELEKYCGKTVWLEKGRIRMFDDTEKVVEEYRKSAAPAK